MSTYYEQIDELQKKQIEEALLSIEAQEKAALARLNSKKDLALQSYQNATAGAYTDYAHAVNPYGYNNENLYSGGLGASGKSESAKAAYYNAYTSLLGSLKSDYSKELTELNLEEGDILAQSQKSATDAKTQLYAKQLEELIRRQELEREDIRFEYEKQKDERDYNFKVEQAQYQKEKDQRDYAYKLASSSGGSGGSYSAVEENTEDDHRVDDYFGIDLESTEPLDKVEFARLKQVFLYLTSSVLPGEDNPTSRIRRTKEMYINMFKTRLTSPQLLELLNI